MSKILFKNYWINLKQTSRGFVYAERRNINSTATLLFKRNKSGEFIFLLRYQPLPELTIKKKSWKQLYPCCVTGSLEKKETPLENVIKEVYEETNYIINKQNIVCFSQNVSSTQMNELVYTFVVDITDCKKANKKNGDGSIFENVSKNKWVNEKQLKNILINKKFYYLSSLASAYLLFKSVFNKTNFL